MENEWRWGRKKWMGMMVEKCVDDQGEGKEEWIGCVDEFMELEGSGWEVRREGGNGWEKGS